MAKFRIRLKLQALELEIDGEREDIPGITSAVQQQFGGLIQPVEAIVDGRNRLRGAALSPNPDPPPSKARGGRRRGGAAKGNDSAAGQPVAFRHDPAKFGVPRQGWTVLQKAIWMLLVIKRSAGPSEIGGSPLAATFNQQFKQAGKLRPNLVTRELGRAKVQSPALVGEDAGNWYLTNEGERYAQELIQSDPSPASA